MEVPINGWLKLGNPKQTWMMTGGTISGNLYAELMLNCLFGGRVWLFLFGLSFCLFGWRVCSTFAVMKSGTLELIFWILGEDWADVGRDSFVYDVECWVMLWHYRNSRAAFLVMFWAHVNDSFASVWTLVFNASCLMPSAFWAKFFRIKKIRVTEDDGHRRSRTA